MHPEATVLRNTLDRRFDRTCSWKAERHSPQSPHKGGFASDGARVSHVGALLIGDLVHSNSTCRIDEISLHEYLDPIEMVRQSYSLRQSPARIADCWM